jgi:hypothetical protein
MSGTMNEKNALERNRDRLLAIPGVTGLAIGNKTKGGHDTGQRAVVVFVEKKRDDVAGEERIPSEVDGIPTDVVEREFDIVDL